MKKVLKIVYLIIFIPLGLAIVGYILFVNGMLLWHGIP